MKIDCLTLEKGYIRFKRYKLTLTPYLQEVIGCGPFIFTDDASMYLSSVEQSYDVSTTMEVKVEYKWEDDEQLERLQVLNKDDFNQEDAINFLNEYSSYVYYGYISPNVQSVVLSPLKEEHQFTSTQVLDREIINIVKEIRKEFFTVNINFKGKEIKPNDKTIARLGMITYMDMEGTIPFRFEDGSFVNLTTEDVKKMYKAIMEYTQKVMKVEQDTLQQFLKLETVDKELLLTDRIKDIKRTFDSLMMGGNA